MSKERFAEYKRHIQQCVTAVQGEMSLGNVISESVLQQQVTSFSEFLNVVEAFTFFHQYAPYEWPTVVTPEVVEGCSYDLGAIILHVVNAIVCGDVMDKIIATRAYDFLVEGQVDRYTTIMPWNGWLISFQEHWKNDAQSFDYLPQQAIFWRDHLEITAYGEDNGPPTFTAVHTDPALAWISDHVASIKRLSFIDFETLRCGILRKFGFPLDHLWLSECQSVAEFTRYYGNDYGLESFRFVVYWHESGSVMQHCGFNTFPEFVQACECITRHSF